MSEMENVYEKIESFKTEISSFLSLITPKYSVYSRYLEYCDKHDITARFILWGTGDEIEFNVIITVSHRMDIDTCFRLFKSQFFDVLIRVAMTHNRQHAFNRWTKGKRSKNEFIND